MGEAVSTEADGVAGGLGDFSTVTVGVDVCDNDAGMLEGGCCFFLIDSL